MQLLLKPSDSLKIASSLGIPVPEWSYAPELEPPVYIKADVPLPHKSERGAVKRASTREEEEKFFKEIVERFGAAIVQKEVSGSLELLVSSKGDDAFGRVLIVALGGTLASLLSESVVTPCPLCWEALMEKASNTKLGTLLKGYRGQKVDLGCLRSVLERLCGAEAKVFEINPLILGSSGCWAVDVKVWK